MSHNPKKPEEMGVARGVRISGVVVFLVALSIIAGVAACGVGGVRMHRFHAQRVQSEDYQDVAGLHAREDLLLENYSWDESQGKVRIPIERAMELIALRGLPVAKTAEQAPLMTGDQKLVMAVPLTNGFTRTDYELDQAEGVSTARPAKSGQRR
ncbi:MAG: hypothetical protein ABSB30_13590 [Terracidiphilus sp.]|jgi:hypothetical protein